MSDNSSDDDSKLNKSIKLNSESNSIVLNENNILMEYSGSSNPDEILPAFPITNKAESQAITASESLAVQYLEELFNNGSITGSEMALYKKRFCLLCQLLEKSRENEFTLLQLSKKWTVQLEKDKATLALSNDYPDDSSTEVSKMRQGLLKFHNDNLAIEDRLETLNYKVISLEEEKKMLENELKRLPGLKDILKDKEIKKRLEDSINELKKERYDLKNKNKEYHELSKRNDDEFQNANTEYDIICENINTLKSKLVENNLLINQYSKAIEKIRKESSDQSDIKRNSNDQLVVLFTLYNEQEKYNMEKEETLGRLKMDFNKMQNNYILLQSQLDEIKKIYDKAKEKETEIQLDKVRMDFDMKYTLNEKQLLREEISLKTKSKDKALKSLKEAKLQLKSNEESINMIRVLHQKAETNLASYPKLDVIFKANIDRKKREIEHRKKLFDVQNIFSEVEKAKLTQSAQEEERLLYDLSDLRIEVVELTRLAQIKADEREQKAKEYILKEKRFHHVTDEIKEKALVQQDYEKKHAEIQSKLEDFAKLYNIIQMERNKCANLINAVTHKGSEMREKIRILNNEIEILRTNLTQKEKYVQKQRSKLSEIISIRDSLQSEISKKNFILASQKEKRDQIQLDIQRLNQLGNQAEEAMVHLRKQNDLALQNRNDRAVQLIERNEEVCILQEKYNIKEEIIRMGEKEIQVRIDEIEFLKQNVNELNRQIELMRKKIDNKNYQEREVVNLKIQIEICRDRLLELELKSENPETDNRKRILDGYDPSPLNLQYKLEELHIKLNSKRESLLEKELLLEAVSRLVNNVQNKVQTTKIDTVELAKSVNDFKFQMGLIVKKLKAKTAELTMNMSKALQLQQEIKKSEYGLKDLYKKIENDEDLEFFNPHKPIKFKQSIMDFEVQQYQLTNGKLTTAEPRPNAYIPENESELPIPRPYGACAPFRPSELGSNMKHIKKQKLKPIEI